MCELVKLVEHFTDSSEFTSVDLTFEWGSGDSTGNYWPKTNQCGDGPTCPEFYRHQLAKKWVEHWWQYDSHRKANPSVP